MNQKNSNSVDLGVGDLIQVFGVILVMATIWLYLAGFAFLQGWYSTFAISMNMFPASYESILIRGYTIVTAVVLSSVGLLLVSFAVVLCVSYLLDFISKMGSAFIQVSDGRAARSLGYLSRIVNFVLQALSKRRVIVTALLVWVLMFSVWLANHSHKQGVKQALSQQEINLKTLSMDYELPVTLANHYVAFIGDSKNVEAVQGIKILCTDVHCVFQTLDGLVSHPMSRILTIKNTMLPFVSTMATAKRFYKEGQFVTVANILAPYEARMLRFPEERMMYMSALDKADRKDALIAFLERLVTVHPSDIVILNNLAFYLKEKDISRSRKLIEMAVSVLDRGDKKSAAVLDTYGVILIEGGELELGINQLQQAHFLAPENKDIKRNLDEALAKRKPV